jgi:hypothetical protein
VKGASAKGFKAFGNLCLKQFPTDLFGFMRAGTETAVNYRCEAACVPGFIQQLAVGYLARGYWFYVTGFIPPQKDPQRIDAKLIQRYGVACSKWVRYRRKGRGVSNVQYLRFRRFFVLLATRGEHEFFADEPMVRDVRRSPIHCFGYSIGCYQSGKGDWHPSVRIEQSLFREIKIELVAAATKEAMETLNSRFAQLPFEPYAPVRSQMMVLLRAVNRRRQEAGMELLPFNALRVRRRPVQPFIRPDEG